MTQRALSHGKPGHFGQPIEYADTAASYSHDDIPEKAKLAKKQILHFLDPNILELKKKPWNNLTQPSGPFPSDHGPLYQGMPFQPKFPNASLKRTLHVGTSTKPEIDFRAEKIPKRDPILPVKTSKLAFDLRKIVGPKVPANLGGTGMPEVNLHTTVPPGRDASKTTRFIVDVDATGGLDMKEAWNPSTAADSKWQHIAYTTQLDKALLNTKKREMHYTIKRTSLRSTYLSKRDEQREQKRISSLKGGNFEDYMIAMSKLRDKAESVEAEAAKQKELDRMEVVFSKEWKAKEYFCDGVWRFDPIEGRHCWSCCGSYQLDGPGCQPRKKAGKGWNFASIN
mmetsp:Transcript_7149/g.16366  ORF Transcript_7149/g.16366 Transcript_7149/m.16366 type:complete len:339 (-) Transcript_7149:1671-2687(-)|eukprot:753643-Hanusia_phi.AAC.1